MSTPDRSREIRAQLFLLLVVTIWASNYPLSKFAIERMDRFVFNAVRYLIAAALLAAILFSRSKWVPIHKSDWSGMLRAGFIANVLYQCAFIIGLSLTTAGNSAVLMSTSPLWTVLLHAKLHKEKIQPYVWLGMGLSLVGVALIIVGGGKRFEFGGQAFIGDLVSLAAAILWAFNTNLQKPLLVRYSALHVALSMITVGSIGLTIVAIPSALTTEWSLVGWEYWVAVFVSGALSIAIGNVLWSYGVQRLGPGRTGIFQNLVPVLALLFAYITLNESLQVPQFFGAIITVAGVWLARRDS